MKNTVLDYLTLGELYEKFSDYDFELTIRDLVDGYVIWHGDFEDMPIKYSCGGFKELNISVNEVEVLV